MFDTVESAVADLDLLFATTARAHDQAKPWWARERGARDRRACRRRRQGRHPVRPRALGAENEEVGLANRIITFPVNPGFASLNLAQAVLLMGYEWFKLRPEARCRSQCRSARSAASQHQMQAFFDNLVRELDKVEFLRPRKSATPCWSICATSSPGWSRPSRTCIRCTAW